MQGGQCNPFLKEKKFYTTTFSGKHVRKRCGQNIGKGLTRWKLSHRYLPLTAVFQVTMFYAITKMESDVRRRRAVRHSAERLQCLAVPRFSCQVLLDRNMNCAVYTKLFSCYDEFVYVSVISRYSFKALHYEVSRNYLANCAFGEVTWKSCRWFPVTIWR